MNFDEALETALQKATTKPLLFSESILFSEECMFVIQPNRSGIMEILVKFMPPEQLKNERMKQLMQQYMLKGQPFHVRFLGIGVEEESDIPAGYAQDNNDLIYGFLLTTWSFTMDSTEQYGLIRSDNLISEIIKNSVFPSGTRFVGFAKDEEDGVHVYDEDVVFSRIWKYDRKFVFSISDVA
jgi:hypothetical protein